MGCDGPVEVEIRQPEAGSIGRALHVAQWILETADPCVASGSPDDRPVRRYVARALEGPIGQQSLQVCKSLQGGEAPDPLPELVPSAPFEASVGLVDPRLGQIARAQPGPVRFLFHMGDMVELLPFPGLPRRGSQLRPGAAVADPGERSERLGRQQP